MSATSGTQLNFSEIRSHPICMLVEPAVEALTVGFYPRRRVLPWGESSSPILPDDPNLFLHRLTQPHSEFTDGVVDDEAEDLNSLMLKTLLMMTKL
ncbi:hypothetical protein U1Q18_034198 [Sarracenia purpurea var. burkii]